MRPEDYEQYENTADILNKIRDLRLGHVETAQRVDELHDRVARIEAHTVAIMQLVEMLAARLGELVPELPVAANDDTTPEPNPYL